MFRWSLSGKLEEKFEKNGFSLISYKLIYSRLFAFYSLIFSHSIDIGLKILHTVFNFHQFLSFCSYYFLAIKRPYIQFRIIVTKISFFYTVLFCYTELFSDLQWVVIFNFCYFFKHTMFRICFKRPIKKSNQTPIKGLR